MSSMEYNKGVLFKSSFDEALKEYPDADIDDLEWDTGSNFVCIDGRVFKVKWDSKNNYDWEPEINNVSKNDDSSFSFETYHYNAGAHWTELLEGKLN